MWCAQKEGTESLGWWGARVRGGWPLSPDGWGKSEKLLGKGFLKPPCPLSGPPWAVQGKAQRTWPSQPSGFRPPRMGPWTTNPVSHPVKWAMGNTSSPVYQHHWSSCSRKCCAVGKKRLLASFLHKRVWLNQRDVWLFNTSGLINSDRPVQEVGLVLSDAAHSFREIGPLLNSPNTARGRIGDTTALWMSRISDWH